MRAISGQIFRSPVCTNRIIIRQAYCSFMQVDFFQCVSKVLHSVAHVAPHRDSNKTENSA